MRIAALALAATLLLAGAPGAQYPEPFVAVGVWYGGATARPPIASRTPAAESDAWRGDLQAIASLGFNSVTTWVDWAGAEPRRGEYRFEALDQMLALAADAGLRVIVQLHPDVAPDWIGRVYPDASFVTDQGVAIGSQAAPGYCLDHPDVRAAAAAFIGAVSERASRARSFHALDLWSPPRLVNHVRFAPGTSFCYCSYTQRRFREWLQRKYASLDALNAAWSRTFSEWEGVEAPRFTTGFGAADRIDWETFLSVKLQEDLQFMTRASAPRGSRPAASHADAPSVMTLSANSGTGRIDDWWMGSAVDYYGTSIAPRPAAPQASWPVVTLASALDGIRSAAGDRGWWLSGLQAGPAADGVSASVDVTPADLRLWSWAAIARGARSLSYFGWYPLASGPDAGSSGLAALDGRISERARAAGAVARILSRNPALFAPMRPRPSRVAILFNPMAPVITGASGEALTQSMHGFYRAMLEHNIQVDFLHADEAAAGMAASYGAVFAPHPVVLQRPVADALAAYVRFGGTLISEARPGSVDGRGAASPSVPGFGLHDVFGVREKSLQAAADSDILMEKELDGPLSRVAGRRIKAWGVAEHLEISGTNVRVVARFPGRDGRPGDPAIVMSRHEKGRAILIGSDLAAAFERDSAGARDAGDMLAALVEGAGVRSEVRISGASGDLEARFLESPAATILIAINYAETPQKVTLRFSADTPEAIWLNLETGASVHFLAGPDGPTYTHAFQPRDALVLMINKEYR